MKELDFAGKVAVVTGANHVVDGGRLCMYQPYVYPGSK